MQWSIVKISDTSAFPKLFLRYQNEFEFVKTNKTLFTYYFTVFFIEKKRNIHCRLFILNLGCQHNFITFEKTSYLIQINIS